MATTSTVDVYQLEKLRLLGKMEQVSSARHSLGVFHNVGISASYTHPAQDTLDLRDAIFSALAAVISRHPILSAIPVDEDSAHPYFARLPTIKLEEAVTFLPRRAPLGENEEADAELDALLQDQHNLPFKARFGELPFWRLMILMNPTPQTERGCEFVASFIFHHSLGDGGAGMLFHKHFLAGLLSQSPLLPSATILSPKLPLTPSLEALHPCVIGSSPTPSTPPGLWSGAKIFLPMRSNLQTLTVPAPTTASLLATCRANQTTITATITVLIASALCSLLPGTYTDIQAFIPVDLRRFLPAAAMEGEQMGVFVDAISQNYTRSALGAGSGFPWHEARRSKGVIADYLSTADSQISVARLAKVEDMREYFTSRVGMDRESSFDVSNLGGLGFPVEEASRRDAGWKVGRMKFTRSAFATGGAFSTSLVTGPDGCLVFGFGWQEGVVEKDLIEGVIKYVKREIESITVLG